ncbi:MAG: enoyl-CoA hydratase/isomerase family protein [Dehalococcoidia bacterium]|nr:enoyl-CoA hydratase/isomerase family protein [Dehalococcoidia bacterium]
MSEDSVLVSKEDGICTVTINRPEKRNAFTPAMMRHLADLVRSIGDDRETRVVVLRGASRQAFSSGYDIEQVKPESICDAEDAWAAIESCPCPVLAMIYGYAVAGGLALALACDLRIAAENTKVGMTMVKIGTLYSVGGLERLMNIAGLAATKKVLYTGRLFAANEALAMGLVDQVAPVDKLEKVTYDLAHEIADNSSLAVRATKLAITSIMQGRAADEQTSERLVDTRRELFESADHQEGVQAFAEKRNPVFRSRSSKDPP